MKVSKLSVIKPWSKQDLGGKRPDKSVCIVRLGGFGDLIQAASVFPYFKDNGWYVTVNTTPRGYDIIKHDPNVDEVFIQETGQVKNEDLGPYWRKLASNFSKFVQFSESVEKGLLAVPGHPSFDLSDIERHKKMNVDYFEQMHKLADAPLPPRPAFYPSKKEKEWAGKYREKMGKGNFVILWALSGSSVHKAWPYMDNVIAQLMIEHQSARVVLVGDGLCQILEENWRNESRVIRKSNKWSIRETLAFAQHCNLVVGPETGVLNSLAFNEEIPKIIMLSHSSPVNLGGSWLNTELLIPDGVDCYPCHKMHYGWATCNRDEKHTGGAMCAASISPDRMYRAIEKKINIPHLRLIRSVA